MQPPKLFISYSWSNPDHEQFVVGLATELRDSGIDVRLDKWDLREGDDAYVFMEQMVTNPDIQKVAMVTDRIYAEKADGRSGGVGTETHIISREVYEKTQQNKFVAVVTERYEDGTPCVPTYYKSRIYIDLSESDKYAENFEKLVRWVFNKPLYVKPELGPVPSYILEDDSIRLGTSSSYKRAINTIKENKPNASGALSDYLSTFIENLERFRITKKEGEFDELVARNIEAFIPYRNEFIQLLIVISKYSEKEESINDIHRFFEQLIPYMDKPEKIQSYSDWDYDNFKFIIYELFLYTIAVFLKYERFSYALYLMAQDYYKLDQTRYGLDPMVSYTEFQPYLKSLEYRNQRLDLRRLSVRADLLQQRSHSTGIEFRYLMQADFVLFMRKSIEKTGSWWPDTLLYIRQFYGAFEIFARSVSKTYFDKVKELILIENPEDLEPIFASYRKGERKFPQWRGDTFDPTILLAYNKLATKP